MVVNEAHRRHFRMPHPQLDTQHDSAPAKHQHLERQAPISRVSVTMTMTCLVFRLGDAKTATPKQPSDKELASPAADRPAEPRNPTLTQPATHPDPLSTARRAGQLVVHVGMSLTP